MEDFLLNKKYPPQEIVPIIKETIIAPNQFDINP